jgi:Helix-turn-helix domain
VTRDPRELPESYQCLGGVLVPNELCVVLAPFMARVARWCPDDRRAHAVLYAIAAQSRRVVAVDGQVGCPSADIPCESAARASASTAMTTGEVAKRLGVSPRTVVRRASERLRHRRRDLGWLFEPEDLETLKGT